MVIAPSSNADDPYESLRNIVLRQSVDGLIMGAENLNSEIMDLIQKSGIPFVFIGQNPLYPHFSIDVNNEEGAYLVTKEIIENTLLACIKTGCAAAGVKSKDTIKTVTPDNIIASTVDRETAVLVQTPQAFKRELIKSAYEKFGFHMTDDCALMEKMGAKIVLRNNVAQVMGPIKLYGATVEARELRGNAALIMAGLVAEGKTTVCGCRYVKRGYEDICRDLRSLGAIIYET